MKTWEDGVRDSIKTVEDKLAVLKCFNTDVCRAHPAGIAVLEETVIHLKAMLERGRRAGS
jgi:hypothetical protein